ncbi:MAG: acyltransferase [Fluviicola sp.]|nr:acyltransferase [Fluviicola sp.]MBP6272046.1 acyltransferase [Fluviicola sp.]
MRRILVAFWYSIIRVWVKLFKPRMLYFYRHQGNVIPTTRVSNSTVITDAKNLNLGNAVFIGHYNFIESSNGITIEEGVQLTNYISVLTHSSHQSIRLYGYEYLNHSDLIGYRKGSVSIGMFSFIGPHVTILPGTKIGKGSIVSAYSMVSGAFPEFAIIAGNPAVVIGDTREKDNELLAKHPELMEFYKCWAEN